MSLSLFCLLLLDFLTSNFSNQPLNEFSNQSDCVCSLTMSDGVWFTTRLPILQTNESALFGLSSTITAECLTSADSSFTSTVVV